MRDDDETGLFYLMLVRFITTRMEQVQIARECAKQFKMRYGGRHPVLLNPLRKIQKYFIIY